MDFSVYWTSLAELSSAEELDFIYRKWNSIEVANFINLVDDFLIKLVQNPYMGKSIPAKGIHCFVISPQTTLFYKIYPDRHQIDLLLFHNNKQNPVNLLKHL